MAYRKRCKWCKEIKITLDRHRKYCSRKCAGLGRRYLGDGKARARAARTALEASIAVRAARKAARWEGVSPQVAYERGYGAGYYAGRQAALTLAPPTASTPLGDTPHTGPDPSTSTSQP
jgi:hypothetical protein